MLLPLEKLKGRELYALGHKYYLTVLMYEDKI